jgi:hypothetical protein
MMSARIRLKRLMPKVRKADALHGFHRRQIGSVEDGALIWIKIV